MESVQNYRQRKRKKEIPGTPGNVFTKSAAGRKSIPAALYDFRNLCYYKITER